MLLLIKELHNWGHNIYAKKTPTPYTLKKKTKKKLVAAESHRFYKAKQEECEFASNFFVHPKRSLSKCKFWLNNENINRKLLFEGMSHEDAFKMAQADDVAHIKNKDMNDLHKMFPAKLTSDEIQKGRGLFLVW